MADESTGWLNHRHQQLDCYILISKCTRHLAMCTRARTHCIAAICMGLANMNAWLKYGRVFGRISHETNIQPLLRSTLLLLRKKKFANKKRKKRIARLTTTERLNILVSYVLYQALTNFDHNLIQHERRGSSRASSAGFRCRIAPPKRIQIGFGRSVLPNRRGHRRGHQDVADRRRLDDIRGGQRGRHQHSFVLCRQLKHTQVSQASTVAYFIL